jgi:hypothetical protein
VLVMLPLSQLQLTPLLMLLTPPLLLWTPPLLMMTMMMLVLPLLMLVLTPPLLLVLLQRMHTGAAMLAAVGAHGS